MKLFFGTIFLIFISASLNAQIQNKNISATEYDINDPRNPNCPCHKLQKQAEEEYKQKQTINPQKNLFAQQYFETSNFENQTVQYLNKLKTKDVIELDSYNEKDIPNSEKINNNHIKNSYNSATVKSKVTTKKLRLKKGKKMKPKRKPLSGSNFKSAKKRVVCFVW